MPTTTHIRRLKALAAVCAVGLLAVACGDDEDGETAAEPQTTAAEGEATGGEHEDYCAAVAEMEEAEEFDAAQFERIKDTAPEEISDEIDYVADAFIAAEGDAGTVFADPKVEEMLGPVEEFEAEHCESGAPEGEAEDEAATEPLAGAQVIDVTAVDFSFQGIPAEVPAGATSFEMDNQGESPHEMVLVRLGQGVVLDELLASGEEPSPEEAEDVGSTFAAPGEGGAYLNVEDLTPGTYAVICFVPGPEGKAHHELGMKTTFQVG